MRLFNDDIRLDKPTMFFIGVSTHNSTVGDVFYDWIRILKKDAELIGFNLNVDCDFSYYTKIVNFIKSNPLVLGALVTTHKVRLYNSAKDIFDVLPNNCVEFKEIGCIYKDKNLLCGEVTDIFSVKAALDDFLPQNYFNLLKSDFCILGCGGAGLALAYRILTSDNVKPNQLIMTDVSSDRLEVVRNILEKYDKENILRLCFINSNGADDIIENLRQGSVIVNATGLGKDREGSPFSIKASIPSDCYLWEFNYRGKLDFLRIAEAQAKEKNLKLIDGWVYFVHGWSQVMSRVFHEKNISAYFNEFLHVANTKR